MGNNKKKKKKKKQQNTANKNNTTQKAAETKNNQSNEAEVKQPVEVKKTSKTDKMPAKEPSFSRDRNLELKDMTRKERHQAKKEVYAEYTKDMSTSQKLSYFLYCYKWRIIIPIVAVLLICYVGKTIYNNTRPLALGYVVLNIEDTDAVNTDFEQDYVNYRDMADDYRYVSSFGLDIDYDYFKEHEEYITTSNSTDYNILMTRCELGDYDVIITNATGLKYCSTAGIANALKGYLDSYTYEALTPYMYDSENANGTLVPYALDISDTEFAKQLNTGYSDVYLALPGVNDENKANALKFIEYIYGIDLSEGE